MKEPRETRNWLHHLGQKNDERDDNHLKTKKKGERIMKRLERVGMVVLVAVAVLVSFPLNSEAAFDAFLKIDGIPGESTDDKHREWIEILSYGMGVSQPASASMSGGSSVGRPIFDDVVVVKALDKASPKLAVACADGTHIKEVVLELCRAGGDKVKYMEYKLTNVIISHVAPQGNAQGGETLPLEMIHFSYSKIEWTYTQQKREDGSGGGQVAGGWDLEKDCKV